MGSCEHSWLDWDGDIEKHGRKLPHWQQGTVPQFVTFRLADSLPSQLIHKWKEERRVWLQHYPPPWTEAQEKEYHQRFTRAIEVWLDRGHGRCCLMQSALREVLTDALMKFDGVRVLYHAWVIMPNHVHVLFTPLRDRLPDLVRAWKGCSARAMHALGLCDEPVWQKNYRDTLIRDEWHFRACAAYIRRNPRHLTSQQFTLYESEEIKELLGK